MTASTPLITGTDFITVAVMQTDAFGIEFRANNTRLLAGPLRRPGRQPAGDPPPLRAGGSARGRLTARYFTRFVVTALPPPPYARWWLTTSTLLPSGSST
jgi:hypothetical protein